MPTTCSSCGATINKTAKFCGQCGASQAVEVPEVEEPKKDVVLLDIPNNMIALAAVLETAGLALLLSIVRRGGSLSALEKLNVNLGGKLDNAILWWTSFGLGVALAVAAIVVIWRVMEKAQPIETKV